MTRDEIIKKAIDEEKLCEHCEMTEFGTKQVNTCEKDLCEGRRCEDAEIYFIEDYEEDQLIENALYLGDCLELMNRIEDYSIDMILCDLPYGITAKCKWDSIIPFPPLWKQYERILKDNGVIALTASNKFHYQLVNSNLEMFKYEWVWEKSSATGHLNAKRRPMVAHEFVDIFYKKQPTYNPQKTQGHTPTHSNVKRIEVQNNTEVYGNATKETSGGGETDRYPRSVLKFPSDKQNCSLHPTQKPLALMEYLVKTYTNENDLVLDNCMGSNTTGLACKNLNRRFIGIELEEKYFKTAQSRIA